MKKASAKQKAQVWPVEQIKMAPVKVFEASFMGDLFTICKTDEREPYLCHQTDPDNVLINAHSFPTLLEAVTYQMENMQGFAADVDFGLLGLVEV